MDKHLFSYCATACPLDLTIDASAQGINEIMWFLRPSKLSAISKSGQGLGDAHAPGPAAA